MPVDRPTFSESWYRVGQLKPRLRTTVQTYRQHYRGQLWHVVQDPTNNQYFRLNDAAYTFVSMLDAKRTVEQVWEACNELLGDHAPTQGEAIQLLGELYTSNLLQSDLPADAQSMFERQRKRVRREVRGYLQNFLFIRLPVLDPDYFLERTLPLVSWVFSPIGMILWAILVIFGVTRLAGRSEDLFNNAAGILAADNLFLLYTSFAVIKAIHELGHGYACKRFGKLSGSGGEVHTIGIMFLVFMPVPYVDATSAWALRSKWQRAFVGAAGMYVELAVAAAAAIVWANTSAGPINAIAYNMMFIASVSTILFNANPLLRFDGYYILSDILEIPNLAQRSKDYLSYLVRKYVYGVRNPRDPSHSSGERGWFVFYGIGAGIYRVIISVGIILFVANALFFVGVVMAITAIFTWVFVPLGKFIHYLGTSPELMRVRTRAIVTSAIAAAVVFIGVGVVPAPDRARTEGVIEPRELALIYMEADGFVYQTLDSGLQATPDGEPLLVANNPALLAQRDRLRAERRLTEIQWRQASLEEIAVAQGLEERIVALDRQLERVEQQLSALTVKTPRKGQWVSPKIDRAQGAFIRRGEQIGLVASVDQMIVRAVTDQELGPRLKRDMVGHRVEIRIKGQPELKFAGRIEKILSATEQLPSAALGYLAGGQTAVASDDPSGRKTLEPFFPVQIRPEADGDSLPTLLSGQRVEVRFDLGPKPLAQQWWLAFRQLIQRRFQA